MCIGTRCAQFALRIETGVKGAKMKILVLALIGCMLAFGAEAAAVDYPGRCTAKQLKYGCQNLKENAGKWCTCGEGSPPVSRPNVPGDCMGGGFGPVFEPGICCSGSESDPINGGEHCRFGSSNLMGKKKEKGTPLRPAGNTFPGGKRPIPKYDRYGREVFNTCISGGVVTANAADCCSGVASEDPLNPGSGVCF